MENHLPDLTPEQRAAALRKATEARVWRGLARKGLASGETDAREALASDDPVWRRMPVRLFLESLPGIGRAKAAKIMGGLGISGNRRLGGLGAVQREHLSSFLDPSKKGGAGEQFGTIKL